ncbi:patatin-like phospholipase family protein [Hydrogenophaga sp.]|uniref:patatin-like phospholipase family protein n=1 Tax=Hydrogenophaga sp. TaxID=1904254 RepID=UPI00286E2439|nr:patatin-like phospholipase family protein [Hydrogenophaga sp.]
MPSLRPTLHAFVLFLLCAALSGPPPASAQVLDTPAAGPGRPRVGLVLSGGGARGLTHVGVLKVLEEAQVPVDLIVGTSMGAIIGGLYASGMSAAELEREVLAIEWGNVFERREPRQQLSQRRKEEDFELSPVMELGFRDGEFRLPTGAVSTRGLEVLLRRYTLPTRHLATFDGLPTPFRAVATDMETGQPVVLDHGDLAAALRASMSVPGVFSPLEVDGRILGDGGLVDNLPVAVARRMGAELIIAINIGTPLAGRETLGSLLGITTQMVNILTEQNVQASVALLTPQDLLLQPSLGKLTSADFDRAPQMVKIGEDYGRSVLAALQRFAAEPDRYARWLSQRGELAQTNQARNGSISAIRFEGVNETRAQRLAHTLDTRPGMPLDVAAIEDDLQKLAASGDYERVDYRLQRLGDGEALRVQLRENDWGPNYLKLGLDLRTDFEGQGDFNLRISHNRHWLNDQGAEWRNRLQVGRTLAAYSELYQPLGGVGDRFVSGYVDAQQQRVELYGDDGEAAAIGFRQGVKLGVDIGWPMGLRSEFGDMRVGVVGSLHRAVPELVGSQLASSGLVVSTQRWRELGLRAAVIADQLDFANFPSSGYRAKGELVLGRRAYSAGGSSSFSRLEGSFTGVRTWGRHSFNVGARLAHASQIPLGAIDEFSLGGFQQLSGYRVGQVAGNYLLFGRLTWYRRMDWSPGVARAMFTGASLEAGNAWLSGSDIGWKGLRAGSSLFVGADTGLGPLYLSLVHAPKGYTGLYLFLGRP